MFPIVTGKDYAVITGDVIDSSSYTAPERQELSGVIREADRLLREWLSDVGIAPLAIFSGDSWQLLLDDPSKALHAAVFMRSTLRAANPSIDSRMAVAIGTVDFVPEVDGVPNIEEADGEAFRLSGRALHEGLGRRRTIRFLHPDADVAEQWDLVCHLIDTLIYTNWTDNRARAVSGALRGLTQTEIGELWPTSVSKQTVNEHLEAAGWEVIFRVLSDYST